MAVHVEVQVFLTHFYHEVLGLPVAFQAQQVGARAPAGSGHLERRACYSLQLLRGHQASGGVQNVYLHLAAEQYFHLERLACSALPMAANTAMSEPMLGCR